MHPVHVALVVKGLPLRVLQFAGVRAEGDQPVVVKIPLAPIPLVESFEPTEGLLEKLHVAVASVDPLDAPGEDGDLGELTDLLRFGLDGHRDHISSVVGCVLFQRSWKSQ